jgi:hypothetical protein
LVVEEVDPILGLPVLCLVVREEVAVTDFRERLVLLAKVMLVEIPEPGIHIMLVVVEEGLAQLVRMVIVLAPLVQVELVSYPQFRVSLLIMVAVEEVAFIERLVEPMVVKEVAGMEGLVADRV